MRKIERKEYDANLFISELKDMVGKIVINVLSDNSHNNIVIEKEDNAKAKRRSRAKVKQAQEDTVVTSVSDIICPVCKKGHLLKGSKAFGCSEYRNGCSLRLPFEEYNPDLEPTELLRLIESKLNIKK